MEALNNYFETTRELLNKKKSSIGEEYKIALKIASFFDMIYEKIYQTYMMKKYIKTLRFEML